MDWNSFLNLLNEYGGLVSFISLIFSIIIFVVTGNIKRSIIQKRQFIEYKREKRIAVKHLEELVASIECDQLFDNGIKKDLLIEINKLLKYKGFIDFHGRYYVFRINHILAKNHIESKNSDQIVALVAKLCGRMSVDPVNKEMG